MNSTNRNLYREYYDRYFVFYHAIYMGYFTVLSDCSVGIDAEVYSENVDLSIAKNYFSYGEYQFIIKDKRISDRSFIQIWTLKESYIKNSGMGLVIPMDSFSVEQRNGKYGVFENGIRRQLMQRL